MQGQADLKIVKTGLGQLVLPPEMIQEIVLPNAFAETPTAEWVPLGNECYSRPLCLNVSEGYWAHLFRVRKPGFVNRHRHSSQVHVLTLKGHWHYPEKNWVAAAGTYVFEPPGDVHTLIVPEGGAEMMFLSIVRGALLYVDEQGKTVGYDDVFTRIESARRHYAAVGL